MRSATLSVNNPNQTLITLLTGDDSSPLGKKNKKKLQKAKIKLNHPFVNMIYENMYKSTKFN